MAELAAEYPMLGAIAGDMVGSVYEHNNLKSKDFPLFGPGSTYTDDTVCTLAIARCLLAGDGDFAGHLRALVRQYPERGYGGMFRAWALRGGGAYDSWGNGGAMRVSPVAWIAPDEAGVLEMAQSSAAVTHSHPEGIKGAQAAALALWLARGNVGPDGIRARIVERFGYNLGRTVDQIRPGYAFDVSAAGSVPEAIICALEARNFEDALRNAVSIGGDSDTIACIAGGIAEARFGLPANIRDNILARLPAPLEEIALAFQARIAGRPTLPFNSAG